MHKVRSIVVESTVSINIRLPDGISYHGASAVVRFYRTSLTRALYLYPRQSNKTAKSEIDELRTRDQICARETAAHHSSPSKLSLESNSDLISSSSITVRAVLRIISSFQLQLQPEQITVACRHRLWTAIIHTLTRRARYSCTSARLLISFGFLDNRLIDEIAIFLRINFAL